MGPFAATRKRPSPDRCDQKARLTANGDDAAGMIRPKMSVDLAQPTLERPNQSTGHLSQLAEI
jgi:hypothetical protein